MKRRILAWLVVLCMTLTLIPMGLAESNETTDTDEHAHEEEYLIADENVEEQHDHAHETAEEEEGEEKIITSFEVDMDQIPVITEEEWEKISQNDELPEKEKKEEDSVQTEAPAAQENENLGWNAFLEQRGVEAESLDKEGYLALYAEFAEGKTVWSTSETRSGNSGNFSNDYLSVAVSEEGRFTIGTKLGNPNYSSDDNNKLLYGHPSPGTSETLIVIDDSYQEFFSADVINYSSDRAVAIMYINDYNLVVTQTLTLVQSGNVSFADTVKIEYQVSNYGDTARSVGIRIMLDTMIASNDSAPFKIPGTGNVVTCKTYTGASIPASYQVYDNLENPTTLATGYLIHKNERVPDKVQFCSWPNIRGSSWSYSASDGSSLGDSAVGIYFDKTEIKSNRSMTVSTYYGVGVGASLVESTDTSCTVSGNEVVFKVVDAETGFPVEGVRVNSVVNTQVDAVTDREGVVRFNLFEGPFGNIGTQILDLAVGKDGYKMQTYRRTVSKGYRETLFIAKNDTPVITGVFLDNVNLISGTVHFIENYDDKIKKGASDKKGVARIVATSDTEGCVFYFMEDERVLQKNKTGVFTFDTLETDSGTLIDSLSSQGNRYIKCVAENGKSCKKIRLGINVSIPSVKTKSTAAEIADFFGSGSTGIAKGTLAALFLGDTFKFGLKDKSPWKVKIEITEEKTVRIGVNLKEIPKSAKERKDLYDSLCKAWMHPPKGNFAKKITSLSIGKIEPSFSFYGYGEGQIEDGSLRVDVVCCITGEIEASYTVQYFFVVPLYITIGGKIGMSAEVKFNVLNSEGFQFNLYSGTLKPQAALWVEGGVGVKGVINLGVEGKGSLDLTWNFVTAETKITATLAANLKAQLFFFEKSLNLVKTTYKLYDSNDSRAPSFDDEMNIWEELDAQPFRLQARSPRVSTQTDTPSKDQIFGIRQDTRNGAKDGDEALVSFEYTSPKVLIAGKEQYRFWIWDNTSSEQVSNSNTLVYAKQDEEGYWSDSVAVLDDGTSDFYYDVAADDQYLYVVWHNSAEQYDDSTVQPDDMMQTAEIYYTQIDRSTGEQQTLRLTNDREMDSMPAIAVQNGNAYIAWYHTANGAEENELPNYLYYTMVQNMVCSEVHSIDYGNGYLSGLTADVIGGEPIVIYAINNNGEYQDADMSIHSLNMRTGAEQSLANKNYGNAVIGELNGEKMLFWREDDNIAYGTELSEEPEYIFDEVDDPATVPAEFVPVVHNGITYLVWTANQDEESNFKQAIAIRYIDGAWSDPFVLGTLDYGNILSINAFDNYEGKLTLVYTSVNYNTDGTLLGSGMNESVFEDHFDIRIDYAAYEISEAIPGEALPLQLTVTNTGTAVLDEMTVNVKAFGYEDSEFETVLNDLAIEPGKTKEVTVDGFVLPAQMAEEEGVYSIDIEVYQDGCYSGAYLDVGFVDFLITQQPKVIMDNQKFLPVFIENLSGFEAKNVHIRVLADSEEGLLLYDEILSSIPGLEGVCAYVNIDALTDSMRLYVYVTTDSPQTDEEIRYTELYISDEAILLLGAGELTVTAGNGGVVEDVSGTYTEESKIALSAQPDEGYVFDCWISDREVEFDDAEAEETEMTMLDGDVTVTALFVKSGEKDFSLTADALELEVGETAELKAQFADNQPCKVTWSSENPAVASVSNRGVITAISAGETEIVATCGSYSHTCTVTVRDISITAIQVIYPSLSLSGIGASAEIETLVTPASATSALIFTSSDESVASVSDTGVVTAEGYGTAEIIVKAENDDSVMDVCTVSVLNTLNMIRLEPATAELILSEQDLAQTDVSVIYDPIDSTDDKTITWTNYAEDVVSISSSGEFNEQLHIVALGTGTAMIQAKTGGGLEAWLRVNVICLATGIEILTESSPENPYLLYVGKQVNCQARLLPEEAEGTIGWRSSDDSVASVSSNGLVYGETVGDAVITAYFEDLEADFYVRVIEDEVIVDSIEAFQSDHNYSNNLNRVWTYNNPDAIAISLTFSEETATEYGYDYLYILDENDCEVGSFTGTELAGQTVRAEGRTVHVRLRTDGSVTDYGFVVIKITIHYPDGWKKLDGKWYYYQNGDPVIGWQKIGNAWYYFDADGAMQTGWQKIGSAWYYFTSGGSMVTGWQKIGNAWYHFTSGGAMQTGWQKISNKWYYFTSGGQMVTGWQKLNNKWYYFASGGAMLTGWQKISNKWYYFEGSGAMVTGWKKLGNTWYYFQSGGQMQTGWLKLNNKWYYFESSGAMVANTSKTISGKVYRFDANGVCLNP